MRYTQEAMDALREARRNNPNVSQRRMAYNIFMLIGLGQVKSDTYSPFIATTRELLVSLGNPSEIALQHLIRGIDRQAREKAAWGAAVVTNSEAPARKSRSPRPPNGRKSRARSRKSKTGGLSIGAI